MLIMASIILIRQRKIATFFIVYKVGDFEYEKGGSPSLSLILHQSDRSDEMDCCSRKVGLCFRCSHVTAFLFAHLPASFP